jgi:hypothetical protein
MEQWTVAVPRVDTYARKHRQPVKRVADAINTTLEKLTALIRWPDIEALAQEADWRVLKQAGLTPWAPLFTGKLPESRYLTKVHIPELRLRYPNGASATFSAYPTQLCGVFYSGELRQTIPLLELPDGEAWHRCLARLSELQSMATILQRDLSNLSREVTTTKGFISCLPKALWSSFAEADRPIRRADEIPPDRPLVRFGGLVAAATLLPAPEKKRVFNITAPPTPDPSGNLLEPVGVGT